MTSDAEKQNLIKKPRLFRGLRWKMTFSFLLVCVTAWFITNQTLGLIAYLRLRQTYNAKQSFLRASRLAKDLTNLLSGNSTNPIALNARLFREREQIKRIKGEAAEYLVGPESFQDGDQKDAIFLCLTDANGKIIAATEEVGFAEDFSISGELDDDEKSLLTAVLSGERDQKKLMLHRADQSTAVAVPVLNGKNQFLGALLIREKLTYNLQTAVASLLYDFVRDSDEVVWYLIFFSVIFGVPVAGHLTRRLNKIALTARMWSNGDFSSRIEDHSADELHILARHLNRMANKLHTVFTLRQELAASEERNRIARDLHDSVKQQVFALIMQIGAAQLVLEKNCLCSGHRLKGKLDDAAAITQKIQNELIYIINNLHPVQSGETLLEKIHRFAQEWSRQNGIKAEVISENGFLIPPFVGEYGLFRIAQEALSNVARHSQARQVTIEFQSNLTGGLRLSIADDGCGFELTQAQKGSGLRNMRERAEQLPSGWFVIKSQNGLGTRVEIGCRLNAERNN